MKKLKLQLDGLRVESFETVKKERAERGTVRGHLDSTCATCPQCAAEPYVVNGDPLYAPGIDTHVWFSCCAECF